MFVSKQRAAAVRDRVAQLERDRVELVERVRAHIEASQLGPAEVKIRVVDKAILVMDRRAVVHAVIRREALPNGTVGGWEARDLRGYRWAPSVAR